MNIQYTTSTVKRKTGTTELYFFCLYSYIPLQMYTVPKNEKLRYWLDSQNPNASWGLRGQRSGGDTFTPFSSSVCQSEDRRRCVGPWLKEECVCVCLSLSRWKPLSMTWNILHRAPSVQSAQQQEAFTRWSDDLDPLLSLSHFHFPILCLFV